MSCTIAIILAAGKGTRMKSRLPKVLHQVGGKFMVEHVTGAMRKNGVQKIVTVIGHEADMVSKALGDKGIVYAVQEPQLGTGHAVMTALTYIEEQEGTVLVACGDTPLLRSETFQELMDYHHHTKAVCTILTAKLPDPTGYGRIIRGNNLGVTKIVEQKDASAKELQFNEINTGTYCFDLKRLREAAHLLTTNNAQGEYYLTDTIAYFVSQGLKVNGYIAKDYQETLGVNSRSQLAEAEKILRMRKAQILMDEGVTIVDPATTFIDEDVQIGMDTVIEPFTFLRGKTTIGSDCVIGPNCDIQDSLIKDGVRINRAVMIEAEVGENSIIGPFAYLRPGSKLHSNVKVGDFVEIKKSVIGEGSKVPHLSYVGDAEVGKKVNIGCGTITCNYDGKNKHRTVIKDGAFIGSNTNLVAPVQVGSGAMTGAGSTITKNVPDDDLALARGKQINLAGWAAKKRQEQDKSS